MSCPAFDRLLCRGLVDDGFTQISTAASSTFPDFLISMRAFIIITTQHTFRRSKPTPRTTTKMRTSALLTLVLAATQLTPTNAYSGEVSSLMKSKPKVTSAFKAGAASALLVGGAASALLPTTLEHNINGAMDVLVAAAAASVVGSSPPPVAFEFFLLPVAVAFIAVLAAMYNRSLAHIPGGSLLSSAQAETRARLAAVMAEADDMYYAGSWLQSMGCGEAGCDIFDRDGAQCVQVADPDGEGEFVWVCV